MPGWVNKQGKPASWRHYKYGMDEIARMYAREQLRAADAASIAWAQKEKQEQWRTALNAAADWI